MWLSSLACRRALAALVLFLPALVVAGCSFAPVYGTATNVPDLKLDYAEPASRLDQIIYRDLSLSFGASSAPEAATVEIAASGSSRRVGRTSSGSPATSHEAVVTASMNVTRPSASGVETLYSVSRSASAGYTTAGQTLANRQAYTEASERAAHQLAQTLRLLLAAHLPGKL